MKEFSSYTVLPREVVEYVLTSAFLEAVDEPIPEKWNDYLQLYLETLKDFSDDEILLAWEKHVERVLGDSNANIFICEDLSEAKTSNIVVGHRCMACGEYFPELGQDVYTHVASLHYEVAYMFELHTLELFAPVFRTKEGKLLQSIEEEMDLFCEIEHSLQKEINCPLPIKR